MKPTRSVRDGASGTHRGPTRVLEVPRSIRSPFRLTPQLRGEIDERFADRFLKLAGDVSRISVRFSDENGPDRRGVDTLCKIKFSLTGRPSIVVEQRGASASEAFHLAFVAAQAALRHDLDRSGRHARRGRARSEATVRALERMLEEGTRLGRRSKRSSPPRQPKNVLGEPSRAAFALEDTKPHDRPSRKSTRRSSNHQKSATPLETTRRESVRSAKSQATRAAAGRRR